jgi:hypothetical protein
MDEHKKPCMTSTLMFLHQYSNEGEKFLDHTVTGDATWISYSNVETQKKKPHGVEAQWFAKTKEIQKNSSWQKANGYCFFGQKICFAGGFHESKSNSYISSVM